MKQIHLAAHFPGVNNTTVWSDPSSGSQTDFASFAHLARTAERGKFDFFFLAEGLRLREHRGQIFDLDVVGRPDSLTVLAALAAVTDRIGLAATLNTTFNEPYELARQFATLDHLSNGRAAWNAVTSPDAFTGENFRRAGFLPRDDRYERAAEFIEVARMLWDSHGGCFTHEGDQFTIDGEFDIPRSPQGYPVMIQAGDSDGGRELAAKHADVIFTRHSGFTDGKTFFADVKPRLATYGRRPEDLKIIPAATAVVGDTDEDAEQLAAHIRTQQVSPQGAIAFVEQLWGRDLSGYDPDGPLPDIDPDVEGGVSITRGRVRHDKDPLAVAAKWRAIAEAKDLSIRELVIEMTARSSFVGSPATVAAKINDYVQADAADGYILVPHLTPHGIDRFVDDVVPLLQERGVFRADYDGPTLAITSDCGPVPRHADEVLADEMPVELALIGAGPTASSLLERIAANRPELLPDRALRIHLIDPHRAGTGRVWQPDLHPRLWMNSMAEDVTLFVDDSVTCAGPPLDGPSLYEWEQTIDDESLRTFASPELFEEIRGLSAMSFPTRRVQSVYLDWFHRQVVEALPPHVEVITHTSAAVDLFDGEDGRQHIVLDSPNANPLSVDVVVLSLGHLDAAPDDQGVAFTQFAGEHDLAYIPCGHTAEQDLSVLAPGQDVLVLGLGQAFTDFLVLVTEGRGGRFSDGPDANLVYEPSGLEPVLHVGSRRGVPYRTKLTYRLQAPLAPLPRFLNPDTIAALLASDTELDFFVDVLPLVVKEVGWAYYHELFAAHPERTTTSWHDFSTRYSATEWAELAPLLSATVPDPADHFDIAALDQPLADLRFSSSGALHSYVVEHVIADVARRTDSRHSPDLAAFAAMLGMAEPLRHIAPRVRRRSRLEGITTWWMSFFMYYTSGPPPQRLRQLLALADAGLVKFAGADMRITADEESGTFVATSSSHPDDIRGTALVDARIARPSVSRATSVLLRRLHGRGEIVEDVVTDGDWSTNTGRVSVTGPALQLRRHDGTGHPRRHALGAFTNRQVAGAFARPRFNAPAFRQNDVVARAVLETLAALPVEPEVFVG